MSSTGGWLLSIAGGLALWSAAASEAGGRELWDSPRYWTVWLPLGLLLSLLSGAAAPERAWRWGPLVILMQLPVLTVTAGGGLGLWPLSLIFLLLLSVPAIACALLGAFLSRKLGGAASHDG